MWSRERRALLLLQQLEPAAQCLADMRPRKLFGLVAVARGDGVDEGLMLAVAGRGSACHREGGRAQQRNPVLQFARGVVEIAVARGAADGFVEGAVEPRHLGSVWRRRLDKGLLD